MIINVEYMTNANNFHNQYERLFEGNEDTSYACQLIRGYSRQKLRGNYP